MLLKEMYNILSFKEPFILEEVNTPIPKDNEILVKISACGVCRTNLGIIEGGRNLWRRLMRKIKNLDLEIGALSIL